MVRRKIILKTAPKRGGTKSRAEIRKAVREAFSKRSSATPVDSHHSVRSSTKSYRAAIAK